MEKRRTMTGIRLVTAFLLLCLWAGFMYAGTRESAYHFLDILKLVNEDFTDDIYRSGMLDYQYSVDELFEMEEEYPGFLDYQMLDTIMYANQKAIYEERDFESYQEYPIQTAVLFYDWEGNLLHGSGDYLYFRYGVEEGISEEEEGLLEDGFTAADETVHEDENNLGEAESAVSYQRYGWIDLEKAGIPEAAVELLKQHFYEPLRIIGELDENEMLPVRIEYKDSNDGAWTTIYEAGDVQEQQTYVTIYTDMQRVTTYDVGKSVTYIGEKYANLMELGQSVFLTDGPYYDENADELSAYIRFDNRYLYNTPEGQEAKEENLAIRMVAGFMDCPWEMAMKKMMPYYIGGFVLCMIVWLGLNHIIRERLVKPIIEINQGMENGYPYLTTKEPNAHPKASHWLEIEQLQNNYHDTKHLLWANQNEITRLNTALDYSKRAEESRRQMTSNIAHELKTPLAIIRSYTEGLQEHIADEKKEEYYNIIFSEVDRMDSMVLELLDLSRLEAGRVKLSCDEFSLKMMTEAVLETMANLIADKRLNVILKIGDGIDDDMTILADEGRIYQVLLNFISNAVQYSPEGNQIRIHLWRNRNGVNFSIENVSQPFTEEELAKIWETFYRRDKSRNSKGTGLGLAIAKNIVELHGGKCYVKNTETGVEFGFRLPEGS